MRENERQYWVNSVLYKEGEMARIAITDVRKDRYVAVNIDDEISYRPLTSSELAEKAVQLEVTCDMTVKFYQYGFFIDDVCVMAGDTSYSVLYLATFSPMGMTNIIALGMMQKLTDKAVCALPMMFGKSTMRVMFIRGIIRCKCRFPTEIRCRCFIAMQPIGQQPFRRAPSFLFATRCIHSASRQWNRVIPLVQAPIM